jgi:hypothetical protein
MKLTNQQGWFIFTFMIWLLTLRSTVVFCLLFFWLWLAFLMLGIAHLITPAGGDPNANLIKAGGMFGLLAAFFAWCILRLRVLRIARIVSSLFRFGISHGLIRDVRIGRRLVRRGRMRRRMLRVGWVYE